MKKLLIAGLAAAAFYGEPALAADMAVADLAVKAPPVAPAPALSWAGFYIGANAGFYIGANAGYGWGANNGPITYTNDLAVSVTSQVPLTALL
jgi:outer membrane immunogenic protein